MTSWTVGWVRPCTHNGSPQIYKSLVCVNRTSVTCVKLFDCCSSALHVDRIINCFPRPPSSSSSCRPPALPHVPHPPSSRQPHGHCQPGRSRDVGGPAGQCHAPGLWGQGVRGRGPCGGVGRTNVLIPNFLFLLNPRRILSVSPLQACTLLEAAGFIDLSVSSPPSPLAGLCSARSAEAGGRHRAG